MPIIRVFSSDTFCIYTDKFQSTDESDFSCITVFCLMFESIQEITLWANPGTVGSLQSFRLGFCDVGALIMNLHLTIVTMKCPVTIQNSATALTTISLTVCEIPSSDDRFQIIKFFIYKFGTCCAVDLFAVTTFDDFFRCLAVFFLQRLQPVLKL